MSVRPRFRWLNLAEVVALVGLVIAALTLWNSWTDRRDARADRAASAAAGARAGAQVQLVATPARDGDLALRDPRHDLTDVTVAFPAALGVAAQHPAGDPVIQAKPLRDALLKDDARTGRVPVLVTARFVDGDAARAVTSTYDLVWRAEHGGLPVLGGRALRLTGLRLRARGGSQAALDAAWRR